MEADDVIAAIAFEFKNANQVILEVIRLALMPCLGYGLMIFTLMRRGFGCRTRRCFRIAGFLIEKLMKSCY